MEGAPDFIPAMPIFRREALRFPTLIIFILLVHVIVSGCATQKAATLRERGGEFLASNDTAKALNEYQTSLELEDHVGAHIQVGLILAKQGNCLEAIPHLMKGLELEEKAAMLNREIGACYFLLKAYVDSAENYVKAIEKDPDSDETPVATAMLWPNLDQDERLMAFLDRIVLAQPTKHYGWAFKGNHYFRQGKYEKAIESYESALQIFPYAVPVIIRYGSSLLSLGKKEAAREKFEAALAIQDDLSARFGRAYCMYLSSSFDEALAEIKIILEKDDKFAQAHALAAQIHLIKKNKVAALIHGNRAIELLPKNPPLLKMVAEITVAEGNYQKALDLLSRYVSLKSDDSQAFVLQGICHGKLGDENLARQEFIRAINLDSKNSAAHSELGSLYFSLKQMTPAAISLDEAVRLSPEDARAWSLLSAISLKAGKFNEAMDELETAAQHGFDDTKFLQSEVFNTVRRGNRFKGIAEKIESNAQPEEAMPGLVPLAPGD